MTKSLARTNHKPLKGNRYRADKNTPNNVKMSTIPCVYALTLIQWAGKGVELMSQAQATELGALLRHRRQLLGLSMHQLSNQVNVKQSTITRLERGDIAAPRPDKLARIAKALGLSLADLYARAGYYVPDDLLPSLPIYLHSKYSGLPAEAVTELMRHFDELTARHGLSNDTPSTTPKEVIFEDEIS